jgi:hypothetical protein
MTAFLVRHRSSFCVGAHLPVSPAVDLSSAVGSSYPFLNSGRCGGSVRLECRPAEKCSLLFIIQSTRSTRRTPGMLRASSPPAMTANRSELGSFVVVSLDHLKHGVSEIQALLESLDIPVEVIESGRRLRWNAAVVLRIPEQRVSEAMLALGRRGFADVMAYQPNATGA